ncbi:hypothetical protein IKQ26_03730 [bacterium]|nr:hypothetical protein [bacterium]
MQKVKSMRPEKVIIPIIIFIAIILAAIFFVQDPFRRTIEASDRQKAKMEERQNLQAQLDALESEKEQQQANMNTLKPFYVMQGEFDDTSLASFGGMLEDIVENYIKPHGVMVRSIDYTIDPPEDPITAAFAPNYRSCALELYLICKYPQLHDLVYSLINDFPNFISISQMVVSAYPADKEYLLVYLTINLYTKKPDA